MNYLTHFSGLYKVYLDYILKENKELYESEEFEAVYKVG